MTASGRIAQLNPWLIGCVAAACVAIGIIAGVNPEYGLLAALGLMFTIVTIMDLTLGMVLFTAASFLDVAASSGSFSGTKVIGLVLVASWLAQLGTRRGADLARFVSENTALTVAMLAMLGWAALSFTWAFSGSTALSGAASYAQDMMLVPIMYTAVRRREHAVWVVTAFVVGAVLSGAYGLLHATSSGIDVGRLTGTTDSNFEAATLAAAIPLLISLLVVIRRSARLKVLALIGVVILFAGLVETLSREGLLSLAAVLVGAVVFGGRWRRHAAVLLVIGVAATVGYYTILAPPSSLQRVTMSDTSGRSSIWTVALRVFDSHPVLGVGTGNFILVSSQYLNRPGAIQALYEVQTPKVTHNTYLEALTDLGIPGLLTLLAVLGCAFSAAVRATRLFERSGDQQLELMSRALVLALVAVLVSDVFVSNAPAKYLWLLIALCPVMLRLARRQAAGEDIGEEAEVPAASAAPRASRSRTLAEQYSG
jgi:O-antigen ligase